MIISIIFGLLIHLVIAVQGELELTHLKKPSGSAAITISRVFDFMLGDNPKYESYKVPEFDFPLRISQKDVEFKNERHFIEFLLRNEWVQRRLGIKMDISNGLFPDIKGEIFDGSGTPIRVEVEYWAENYKAHNHPFGGCNLILSFFRQPNTRVVRGVPVWSFYVGKKSSSIMRFCLNDDIFEGNAQEEVEKEIANTKIKIVNEEYNPQFFDGKRWIRISTDPILHERYLKSKGLYVGSPLERRNLKKT